jgi:Recombinase
MCRPLSLVPGALLSVLVHRKTQGRTSLGQARSEVLLVIREIQRADARSLRTIAAALNARGVATARGGRWQAQTVSNVLAHSVQSRRCTELRRPLICQVLARPQRALVAMSLLFQRDFGQTPPAPDLQKTVKPSRARFDFAIKRATWRTERSARPSTRVPVPSRGQIDLEGAWGPPHAHVS